MSLDRASGSGTMPEYDARAWAALAPRERQPSRRLLPAEVRERLRGTRAAARSRFEALPGAERFESLLVNALGGLTEVGSLSLIHI